MSKTDILFVSASVGSGHVRAAEALLKTARLLYPELSVRHIDVVHYVRPSFKKIFFDPYIPMAKKMPGLWKALYEQTDRPLMRRGMDAATTALKKSAGSAFFAELEKQQPAYILATHVLPARLSDIFIKETASKTQLGILVTDYVLHQFWIASKEARYFVAAPAMKEELAHAGVAQENITESGIPVDPVFYEKKNPAHLKERFGIPKERPVVLLLGGGSGLSKMDEVAQALFSASRPLSLIAIAGDNEILAKSLRLLAPPPHIHLSVVGWTDVMDEYMRIADVIVSKPGGMTMTEAITLGTPFVAVQPIPGQEEANAAFLTEHNYGAAVQTLDALPQIVEAIVNGKRTFAVKKPQRAAEVILERIVKTLS